VRASGKAAAIIIAAAILLSMARAQTEERSDVEEALSAIVEAIGSLLPLERIALNAIPVLMEILRSLLVLLLRVFGSLLLSCASIMDAACVAVTALLGCLSALLFSGFLWRSLIPLCASLSLASGPVKACGQLLVDVSG
jgi:hypothetical protein